MWDGTVLQVVLGLSRGAAATLVPCGDGHKGCCCGSQCGQLLIVADRIPGKEYGVCKIVALLVTLPLDRANFLAHLTE